MANPQNQGRVQDVGKLAFQGGIVATVGPNRQHAIETLAATIFAEQVIRGTTTKIEVLAKTAFDQARAFWRVVDEQQAKPTE